MDIKEIIEKIASDYPSEGVKYEEKYYCPGFSFKGEWYNLQGYNLLGQLEIITTALQPLMK